MNITRLTATILNQVQLLDYLRSYYSLDFKISGNSYKCICPIGDHDNKTPSFSIPLNENYFNCFGCGSKGNVINFVEQYHNYTREEAITKICNDIGINIEDRELDTKYYDFLKGNRNKHKEYAYTLVKENKDALDYLTNIRGLSLDIIKKFKLGATIKTNNKFYDNRVVFPIESNFTDDILAFGYGYIKDKDNYEQKYINSATSEFFKKSEIFYGYNQAKDSIRKTKVVNLVEGYFDVLSMHQAGITNTIGVMCASLSDIQIQTLKKLKCEVRLFLDNDDAGIKGITKSIPKLYENGIEVSVISINNINDADELCVKNKFDTNKITDILDKNTKDAILFFISDDIEMYNNTMLQMKRCIIKKIMPIIELLPDIDKEFYKNQIYNML